ncbi:MULTISPECIES: hypothetical protein [unclassified Sphingobacterium]|uniref:hypothetical protein n=2 Tax=unclassified Sphingobacterium TaxID=2609468 RepID=UPI0025DC86D3|nr:MULTISPECIES: hypothetical protein [unclassified Sphingobacterium]
MSPPFKLLSLCLYVFYKSGGGRTWGEFVHKQFTAKSLFIDPVVSMNKKKDLKISFPEFDIKRALVLPDKCNAVVFKFHAFSFDFDEFEPTEIKEVEWEYDVKYKEDVIPAKNLTVKCGDFVGSSIFVGFTMLYLEKGSYRSNVLNEIDFNPASILAAFQLV